MKNIAIISHGEHGSKDAPKPLVPILSEHKRWVADSRFTKWEDVPAAEHAFPKASSAMLPPPPAMTLYEKFGEECASRNILPTYRLFEHWLDSGAIGEDVRDRHLGRRRN